jgi:hypothetical protein
VCAKTNFFINILCPVSSAESEVEGARGGDEGFILEEGLTEADLRESVRYSPDQLNGAAFGMDYDEVLMHGFMFKKSEFYTKVRKRHFLRHLYICDHFTKTCLGQT